MMTIWSPQQDAAIKAVSTWLKGKPKKQVFRLFGYAGTGKTTLAKHLAGEAGGKVLFASFTGKAALVMRSKGCSDASTIHSLIYRVEQEDGSPPTFVLNQASDVLNAKLVVIDECSMVGPELGADLLSFGTPILVLGDPAQLPPVKGQGFFTEAEPDVLLTEVHRQARDNPIISMATTVREGGRLEYGSYGESSVVPFSAVRASPELATDADQILVGTHRMRRSCISRMRHLRGFTGSTPAEGERLVCLKNNRTKGLLNGGIWSVQHVRGITEPMISMNVQPEETGGQKQIVEVDVNRAFFEGREGDLAWADRKQSDEFDFGYALTVHKSQGSQWDNVLVFDESAAFREHRARHLYTAITRAAQKVTVAA